MPGCPAGSGDSRRGGRCGTAAARSPPATCARSGPRRSATPPPRRRPAGSPPPIRPASAARPARTRPRPRRPVPRCAGRLLSLLRTADVLHFARAQRLTVRAIAPHLGPRQQNLETEVALDLLAQPLQRLAEKLLHLAAAQADDVRVLLFPPRLVIMLVARVVHQVQLIDQPAGLQHLQRA